MSWILSLHHSSDDRMFVLEIFCFSRKQPWVGVYSSSLPSCWVNKPVSFPFPSTGRQKALLLELHFSSDVGEFVTTDEAGGSPLAQHTGLVFILWEESR